jgi:uncharacterized membrane protein YedE/YeeE
VAEPRLAFLALIAVLVMMGSVVAILETDDAWLVVVTVAAIALIAAVIVADLWRVLAQSGDEPDEEGS